MKTRKTPKLPTISEEQFTKQVIQFAQLHGWMIAHFRAAMTKSGKWITAVQGDGKGFPDLIAVRGEKVIVAELKVGRNKPSPEQEQWLRRFAEAGIQAYIWRPEYWTEIEGVLA